MPVYNEVGVARGYSHARNPNPNLSIRGIGGVNLSASFSVWAELVWAGRYLLEVTNTITEIDP